MNQSDISTLTDEEISLLTEIVNKGIREIKPRIRNEGIQYESLGDILKEKDYNWNEIHTILNSIVEKGLLIKKEHENILLSPNCSSPHVFSKYSCPKCESTDTHRVILVEHPFCGYTGTLDTFKNGSNLICPQCQQKLSSRNKQKETDVKRSVMSKRYYQIIGSAFDCNKCGNRFDRPNIVHNCVKCGSNFTYINSNYQKIFSYEIPDKINKELQTSKEIAVLVVEDNDDDAEIIQIHLSKKTGFNITRVSKSGEGLNRLEENIYDIILFDDGLQDISGIEFIKEIMENEILTPVILITRTDDRDIAVESMKQGASDYLIKSVEMYERLPSIIRQIIKS